MKVQMTYNGKTVEVEVADEQFEKLFAEKKTGYERSDLGQPYYGINALSNAQRFIEDNVSYDKNLYDSGNYFSEETVAENMARAQRLWNRIHRRAVELCDPVNTLKEGLVYTIYYAKSDDRIRATSEYGRCFGAIYFDTREHCHQVIDEFKDELIWYFTQFKDRADM